MTMEEEIYGKIQDVEKKQDSSSISADIAFVALTESGQIDESIAAKNVDAFSDWAYPVSYKQGNIRKHQGLLYKCIQDHTSQEDWVPPETASLWKLIADPSEEWPEWVPPIGAFDTYALNAKVSHNEKKWVSSVENNVWEPGIYGWDEVIE